MAKVQPPVTSTPASKPGLKPLTPSARAAAAPATAPPDPRGAEPRQDDFASPFDFARAYDMWKDGVPFSEWSQYRKGGSQSNPPGRKARVLKNLPGTLRSAPGETLKVLPGAAVGVAQLAKGFTEPSKLLEDKSDLTQTVGRLLGFTGALDIIAESVAATPQTIVRGVEKLEEGKFPAAEAAEVAGNIALLTGGAAVAGRGRLRATQAKAGAAATEAATLRATATTPSARAAAAAAETRATKLQTRAERTGRYAAAAQDVARIADRIADAPITLPAKGIGRTWQYWVDTRRSRARRYRSDANRLSQEAGGIETNETKILRRKADRLEARYGKVVTGPDGNPVIGPDGKPIITSNAALRRLTNRIHRVSERNQPALIRDMMDLANNEAYGPLTQVEFEAIMAQSNGRAQLIAEIARRTGETPGEIAFKMRPQKSETGRYLSREGAELAVALADGTLDQATLARLTAAGVRLREIMEARTKVKRMESQYAPGAGYGRAKTLDPAQEVPTPKPEWLIEALETEGSTSALNLAEEVRERFQDPETGEFAYDPMAPDTILFIMDIMQDAPRSVQLNPRIYPGKERSNIVAFLSYLRANEALAGFTMQGAPRGEGTTTRRVAPLTETPGTGIAPEEVYGQAMEPDTLSRMPRKYIADAIRQLERLRGKARKIGERIVDLQLKIADYERRIIRLNLELDALNGWYEDGNGNTVHLIPGEAVPAGLEYRPGLIQRARTRVIALRAAVEKMNAEQADTTTIDGATITRTEAETSLAAAETQLSDLETSARNVDDEIRTLDEGIDRLEDESTDLENDLIDEGENPDQLLDALDREIAALPPDPLNAGTVQRIALPASVIAEVPWIQSEYQGTPITRNGITYYEYELTPDDLQRVQRQLEGQVSYYERKPQIDDTPQRLKNLRSGLKTVRDNNAAGGDAYQPTDLFETVAPETARQKQAELDTEHRAAYDELSTLVDEADQLADVARAEEIVYRTVDELYDTTGVETVDDVVTPQAVQQAVYGEWADAFDFLNAAVGLENGKPKSRLLIGLIESSKRRDSRGRVVSDKQGNPIPTSFEVVERLGSLERLRRRKAPYVGFGKSVRDVGAQGTMGASRGLKFQTIDQAMDIINRDGRFGEFTDYADFMDKFVEMVEIFDTLNGFVTTGRLPRRVYSNKIRDFALQLNETVSMTFADYIEARRDPEVVREILRAEGDTWFNQLYDDLTNPLRRDELFPELSNIDVEVLGAMAVRASDGQPPLALTRLRELDPQIVAVQERIAAISEQLAAVEEALAIEEAPQFTSTVAAPDPAAPISSLKESDWAKEGPNQFSIDTGTRRFRIIKVGKVWVLKRIAADGKVLEASAQEFPSFPAARRYVQEGIDFDKTLPTLRPIYRPGRELGPGPQDARLAAPNAQLTEAERLLAQRERKAVRTTELIQERTSRLDKMRVEEARLRALLPAITEAATRLEARLGTEIVTQPDVTVAGELGQPTGRLLVGQRVGPPAVAEPKTVDGVPVAPGSPVGALLRPEAETIRAARRAVGDEGNIEYEVRTAERSANQALLARSEGLPATLPLEVSYAIGQTQEFGYIGVTYFPATYKPSRAPGVRRRYEPGLDGYITVDTEKLKTGEGMDIWSIAELVKALESERRRMDLNEGFRLLISSKFAVTPRMILGDGAIETMLREAEQLATLDPDLNPQYPGAVAAYPLGNPNREIIYEAARNKIFGELIDKAMRDRGFETLPTTGNIDGPVNFEEVNGDRPYLPAYTREKVRARYPDVNAQTIPMALESYMKGVTKTTTAFKQLTLPFSVRWQLGDIIGMFISAAVAGTTPAEFWVAIQQAAKDNYGRFREVFADPTNAKYFKYDRRIQPMARLQGQSGLQAIGLRGEETAFMQGRPLGAEQRGIIASIPVVGRLVDIYQRTIVKGAFRINEAINTVGRSAFSAIQFNKLLEERGLTLDDIGDGSAEMLDPAVREALYDAADIANEFMGDYMDMTPFEKQYVLPHVTFYAWIKHIHKLFAKIAKEHPASIRWHLYLGALAFEEGADPTGLVAGSMLIPGAGYVDLNWASPLSDIALGPVGSIVSAASAGRPIYPENPLRPALGALSPVPRIIGAAGGVNLGMVRGIQRPPGTGFVTSTGAPTVTPLILRPGELTSYALQQFPIATRVLDLLPQGEIPGLGLATGPVRRYDTGQARLRYRTTKPEIKGTGRLGWRGAATKLLTLPFIPELSEEEKERFERTAKVRLRQFEREKRRAEARND